MPHSNFTLMRLEKLKMCHQVRRAQTTTHLNSQLMTKPNFFPSLTSPGALWDLHENDREKTSVLPLFLYRDKSSPHSQRGAVLRDRGWSSVRAAPMCSFRGKESLLPATNGIVLRCVNVLETESAALLSVQPASQSVSQSWWLSVLQHSPYAAPCRSPPT